MRVAPVSADLLIKLALGAAALGVVVWLTRKAIETGAGPVQAIKDAAWAVTPWNPDNAIAAPINAGVSAVVGREETLGGWIYDLTHPPAFDGSPGWTTAGSYNNPSAYVAPLGQGGAAFGIYPRP